MNHLQAPSLHILTLLTVIPRSVPFPQVGYQRLSACQNSSGAVGLASPHGLEETPLLKFHKSAQYNTLLGYGNKPEISICTSDSDVQNEVKSLVERCVPSPSLTPRVMQRGVVNNCLAKIPTVPHSAVFGLEINEEHLEQSVVNVGE
jgi:hypothetical protein